MKRSKPQSRRWRKRQPPDGEPRKKPTPCSRIRTRTTLPGKSRRRSATAKSGHGRNGSARFTGAKRVTVAHATLQPGNRCPECQKGKVYRQKNPKTLIRITGRPPLEATAYELEQSRCNGCGQVFTAEVPTEAGEKKYDESAVAMIAQLRYGSGVPFGVWNGCKPISGYPCRQPRSGR